MIGFRSSLTQLVYVELDEEYLSGRSSSGLALGFSQIPTTRGMEAACLQMVCRTLSGNSGKSGKASISESANNINNSLLMFGNRGAISRVLLDALNYDDVHVPSSPRSPLRHQSSLHILYLDGRYVYRKHPGQVPSLHLCIICQCRRYRSTWDVSMTGSCEYGLLISLYGPPKMAGASSPGVGPQHQASVLEQKTAIVR